MYAVIRTGGKQYRVTEGDVIEVEHLPAKSSKTAFTPILVVTDEGQTIIGAKELKAFSVAAKILGDAKGDKVTVFKYRPKTGYATKTGHRQLYSLIEITGIGKKEAKKIQAHEQPGPDEASSQEQPDALDQSPGNLEK